MTEMTETLRNLRNAFYRNCHQNSTEIDRNFEKQISSFGGNPSNMCYVWGGGEEALDINVQ